MVKLMDRKVFKTGIILVYRFGRIRVNNARSISYTTKSWKVKQLINYYIFSRE